MPYASEYVSAVCDLLDPFAIELLMVNSVVGILATIGIDFNDSIDFTPVQREFDN